MAIRTRFAPSPTGLLHMGNARTALFCYLYAKRMKGQFLLRIEDTDQERLAENAEANIMRDLKWLGLNWDEGPDVGGPLGPYRCSERYDIYQQQLKRLKKAAKVYRCFCTKDLLDQDRQLQQTQKKIIKYVGRCLSLTEEQSEERAKKEDFVWRLHVPEGPDVTIQDLIRGEVTMKREVLGDFVLFRSNGIPVFLFANAVDDALMEISHVIRGEDHLSNTFRQAIIFQMMEWKMPYFAHLPMIGAADGSTLSKRLGSLSIQQLREDGYLPAGVNNYLALLGWSPGDTAETGEIFSIAELCERFDLARVHKGRALFDFQKLQFLNFSHIQKLPIDELLKLAPAKKPEFEPMWKQAIELIRHDASTLQDLYKVEELLAVPAYQSDAAVVEVLSKPETKTVLEAGLKKLEADSRSVAECLPEILKAVGEDLKIKGKGLFLPFRAAITGRVSGPEIVPVAKLIGRDETLRRLRTALKIAA